MPPERPIGSRDTCSLRISASATATSIARRFATAVLDAWRLPGAVIDDARVAIGDVIGAANHSDLVTMSLSREGDRVALTVLPVSRPDPADEWLDVVQGVFDGTALDVDRGELIIPIRGLP